jgi:hypothetical protein
VRRRWRRDPAEPVSRWLSYIAVADPDASTRAAAAEGARVMEEPFNVANVRRAAIIADPQGAPVGFVRGNRPRPDHMPVAGAWLRADCVATDTAAAIAFYGAEGHAGDRRRSERGGLRPPEVPDWLTGGDVMSTKLSLMALIVVVELSVMDVECDMAEGRRPGSWIQRAPAITEPSGCVSRFRT